MALALSSTRCLSHNPSPLAPRFLQPYLRRSWSIQCEPSTSLSPPRTAPRAADQSSTLSDLVQPPSASTGSSVLSELVQKGWSVLVPRLENLLELFPPILLGAAPKKKVSHRKKMQKLAGTGLKNKQNLVNCHACGNIKLMHNLCPYCFREIDQGWKAERRRPRIEGQSGV